MSTTFQEFYQRVLSKLKRSDGQALVEVKEAINTAHKVIARLKDFDDLMVLDKTNAATVASTSTYHLTSDWGLTRPKDIYTLRYMDEEQSRKLTYFSPSRLDEKLPYIQIFDEQKPRWYTRRGMEVELIPVPEEAKPIYVFYSQWPLPLDADDDESSYANNDIDDVIIELSTQIADANLRGESGGDWSAIAGMLLTGAYKEDLTRPDRKFVAQPFSTQASVTSQYWKDPFILKDPEG